MDSETQSRRKTKEVANWPLQVSYFMLGVLTKKHKAGKGSDNGFKKEVWEAIATAINERFNTNYDFDQTRNHYRVWKQRLIALGELQKDSGMGWNEQEQRFCAPQQRWNDMKKKDHKKYWRDHPVCPVHYETLLWMGNEVASGVGAIHNSDNPSESFQDCNTPTQDINDIPFTLDDHDDGPTTDFPSAQTATSTRQRGRPRSDSTTSNAPKKKKSIAEKITSPLKDMAAALGRIADSNSDRDFAKEVNLAVKELPGYDMQQKIRATRYLMLHRMEANAVLATPIEERVEYLEAFMQDDSSG